MAKTGSSGFDPKDRFTSVRKQQGEVQQDSDWNKGGGRRWIKWIGGVSAVSVIAVVVFVLWQQLKPQPEAIVLITSPNNGSVVPLHGTYSVSGEASAQNNVGELQLIVNGQPWGSRTFQDPLPSAEGVWQWTPSGEGTHELILRAIDGSGKVSDSPVVHVLASSTADLLFPMEVAIQAGDTFESLAEGYGVDPQDLIANHPEYDPASPLPSGNHITIPVPLSDPDTALPESGAPPALPKEPLSPEALASFFPIFFAESAPNFLLIDGKLVPGQPMDNLYLYVSVDGETPWRRIPDDPLTFLQAQVDGFDISQYINFKDLESSPEVHSLDVEAWGWSGGSLVFLGAYHGNIGGGLSGWPPSPTQLQIETHAVLGVPQYAHETNLVGENPNRNVKFDWSATDPAVFVMWQISTQPFPANEEISPPGLVMEKLNLTLAGKSGQFNIDFAQFFAKPAQPNDDFLGGIGDAISDAANGVVDSLTNAQQPVQTFPDFLPMTFYVRILASKTGGGFSPSNTVIVRYLPNGEVLTNLSPSGPIYEAQIIEYIPFRPADPAYKACTVLTKDIVFQSTNSKGEVTSQVSMAAGTQSCGCPGVKCDNSSSSDCGWSPTKWGNCLANAGEWFVNALKDTVNYAANAYNDAKSFVIDTVASFACSFIDESDEEEKQACETAINIAANVAITAFTGIPPEIPNFDKLFDEGLEYALATAVSEATGIECDKTCRDLLKKGYEGLSDPEQLYDEGLDYGASLALKELEDQGVSCNSQCQNVIQQGVQGDVDLTNLTEEQIEQKFKQLANEAAQKLVSQNLACDAECENAIFEGYMNGVKFGTSLAEQASQAPPPAAPSWVPHELSQKQPGMVTVRVFRRFESAQLNDDIIAERCSGFSIDSFATNNNYSTALSGRLFEPKFVAVPLIEPGGSVVVPVVLDEATWELSAEFDRSQIPVWMMGYTQVGTEGGEPIGQVQQQLNLEAWWMWNVLNYGSQVDFKFFGPYMLDVVDGQSMGFPCFAESTQSFQNPSE